MIFFQRPDGNDVGRPPGIPQFVLEFEPLNKIFLRFGVPQRFCRCKIGGAHAVGHPEWARISSEPALTFCLKHDHDPVWEQ